MRRGNFNPCSRNSFTVATAELVRRTKRLMNACLDTGVEVQAHVMPNRFLTSLNALHKIDYLFDSPAARTIEALSIARIVVFTVTGSKPIPFGRRISMPQINVEPTLDQEQIVIMNEADRSPRYVPMLVLECPKTCMQCCGRRTRNLRRKYIHVRQQSTRLAIKLRCFLGGLCFRPRRLICNKDRK